MRAYYAVETESRVRKTDVRMVSELPVMVTERVGIHVEFNVLFDTFENESFQALCALVPTNRKHTQDTWKIELKRQIIALF